MWSGVCTYLNGVIESRIYNELLRVNPHLRVHDRKRLREMARKTSESAMSGDPRRAMLQLRSCVILVMQNAHDPEVLASLNAVLGFIPCGEFEEPLDIVCDPQDALVDEDALQELRDRFGVTSNHVLNLTPHRRHALLRTLRHHAENATATCSICWEELLDDGRLVPDVVAIFDEEPLSPDAAIPPRDAENDKTSAVAIVDSVEEDTVPESHPLQSVSEAQPQKPFCFATHFMDKIFINSVRTVRKRLQDLASKGSAGDSPRDSARCLQLLETASSSDDAIAPVAAGSPEPSLRRQRTVPSYVLSRPHLSLSFAEAEQLRHQQRDPPSPSGRCLRLWTLAREFPASAPLRCPSALTSMSSSSTTDCTGADSQRTGSYKVMIRCHLFQGTYLLQWLNTGHWINPMTRCPVLPDDWCRLTECSPTP